MKFRDLFSDEIECRVGTVSKEGKGLSLLLYKNARADMNILDETVGAENWQREHYECKGNLFCRVGIKCGNEWIWKSDCGTESNTEAEKGEASDSFKRACVNWGIGRELYTAPFIWVKPEGGTKNDGYYVDHIVITGKKITELRVKNKKTGVMVFAYGCEAPKAETTKPETIGAKAANEIIQLANQTATNIDEMCAVFGKAKVDDFTSEDYRKAKAVLMKKVQKNAS